MKGAIIGAGIGGLSTAIALQHQGLEVDIYEAAPALKPVGAGIVMASNAMQVFRRLGIDHKSGKQATKFTGLWAWIKISRSSREWMSKES